MIVMRENLPVGQKVDVLTSDSANEPQRETPLPGDFLELGSRATRSVRLSATFLKSTRRAAGCVSC